MEQSFDITRLFKISSPRDKSFFLLGPRQTGKTWLIKTFCNNLDSSEYRSYSLLNAETFTRLSRKPSIIREELLPTTKFLFIDEIQLLPILLNEVQQILSERSILCVMTGSSARKLKRKGVNLLGGRATTRYLSPLVSKELDQRFDLRKTLETGMLPSIYFSKNPILDLNDYVGLYLTEEIAQERATRNVPAFSRFLEKAALRNGEIINFTSVANDAQVAPTTVRDYYSILEDTLIVRELPVWRKTSKLKAASMGKYYFFDVGVARAAAGLRVLEENTKEYGYALECFIYQELWAFNQYINNGQFGLHYWRSQTKQEVDFILNEEIAIEVKSTRNVSNEHLRGMRALKGEKLLKRHLLVCQEPKKRTLDDGIEIVPITEFLKDMWDRNLV